VSVRDIATRVHAHSWRLDPIVRSLLDTDIYKLLMGQVIRETRRDLPVTFSLINRNRGTRLAERIDASELREQLDHARTVGLTKRERTWLAGNTFFGQRRIFGEDYLDWLQGFRLPEYELRVRDGQFDLRFGGTWAESSMWEIPALAVINELLSRSAMRGMGPFELDVAYARAKSRTWDKIERLRRLPGLRLADFGTRRRHSHLWQRWCVEALAEGLGDAFTGTSNVLLAMEAGVEAVGTNAHELPMVEAALSGDDASLAGAPYRVCDTWARFYGGNLLVVLPDAFGTTAFLRHAPDAIADWTGFRPDSKPPIEGGDEILEWYRARGRDPTDKLLVFSDGLDVDAIERIHAHFEGRARRAYGWGTNLTNDFEGLVPGLSPLSLVCKVTEAGGRPAVKLSDNPSKATGPADEVGRYMRVFGGAGLADAPVVY